MCKAKKDTDTTTTTVFGTNLKVLKQTIAFMWRNATFKFDMGLFGQLAAGPSEL